MILAIDTATPAGSVACADQGRILSLRTFDAPREHSRRLFVEIDAVLADAEVERQAIRSVAVTTGPGSFTGVRIGLSAAQGLGMGLGVPLHPVSTLECLAGRLPYCRRPVAAWLDARRGEVYAAAYDTSDGVPRVIREPEVAEPEALLARWGLHDILFTGDGADRWRDLVLQQSGAELAPAPVRRPCADTVAWLAGLPDRAPIDAALVQPDYLRTPEFVPARRSR